MLFSVIGLVFCIGSTILSIIKAANKGAGSFMKEELNTYYLGHRGIS